MTHEDAAFDRWYKREALSVNEFCKRWGICRATFYNEVRSGRLKAVKLGTKTLILRSDAEAWVSRLPAMEVRVVD